MDTRTDHTEDGTILSLYGDATIHNAAELKGVLTRELEGTRGLTVNLAYVTDCDVSFFQLLCAAHRKALKDERPMTVSECSPAVSRVAATGGFIRDEGCSEHVCLWQRKDVEVKR